MISTEQLLFNLPYAFTILFFPLLFVVFWSWDMIGLKIRTAVGRKKGHKFIIDITNDKNIRLRVDKLTEAGKLRSKDREIDWSAKKQYFAPQFGVQAGFALQGAQSIFDPLEDKQVDMADGDVVDRMVKRAELMRELGAKWFDSKEQKLMLLVLVVCIITAGLTFATSAQIGEFTEWVRPAISGLNQAIQAIPRNI